MEILWQDIRYGFRSFTRQPGFALVAVVVLALGIGANTAIFSVVDAALFSEMPFRDAERLAMVWLDNTRLGIRTDITSFPNYRDTRDQSEAFEDLAGFSPRRINLTGDGDPERLPAANVLSNFFTVLGVEPAQGRAFTAAEEAEGGDPVVILSHALWQRRFGGQADVLGSSILLNGRSRAVVGIMPEGFDFPDKSQLWLPMELGEDLREARGAFWLYQIGRLKPGVSMAAGQTEMNTIAARLIQENDFLEGYGLYVQPLREHFVGDARTALFVLFAAVGLVLLIACSNVAHLLLARAASREREIAVRLTLGAGHRRLVRQLLTETCTLAFAGGTLGVAAAYGGIRVLTSLGPDEWTSLATVAVDARVLVFNFVVALAIGMAVGLVPAWQAARTELVAPLKEGGRGASGGPGGRRLRGALVVAEVAIALVLLIGAGLLTRSLDRLLAVDPGFRTSGLLTVQVPLSGSEYDDPQKVIGFYQTLLERVRNLPGVDDAAAGSGILLPRLARSANVSIEGQADRPREVRIEVALDAVTPGFFRAVGVSLLEGRDVADADVRAAEAEETHHVALVNQAMAERYWPDESAVGQRFKFGDADSESPWRTVIGVVADSRRTALEKDARPSAFLAHAQIPIQQMLLVVESSVEPLSLVPSIRGAVREIDPNQPLGRATTIDEQLAQRLSDRRFQTLLLGLFSTLALVLALVGVYGVLAHWVSDSTREIGVRMALGAGRFEVLRLVLGRGLLTVGLGLVIGLGAALVLTRFLSTLLFDTSALEPATFIAIPLLFLVVSVVAGAIPALRATRVHPTEVLRYE